jgi:hypothetical protein
MDRATVLVQETLHTSEVQDLREHPNTDPAALGRSFIAFLMSASSAPLPSVEVRCQAIPKAESAMSPGVGE